MPQPKPNLFEFLQHRGFIAQSSDPKIGEMLDANPQAVYVGFDPTADSLHLGHLVPIMILAHLQRFGHKALAVVGGATGMIGDPSGRSDERNLLTAEQIDHNKAQIKQQLGRFLSFEGENAALLLDNFDWIGRMSFIEWLRDVGKFFTINYMLAKDSVKSRIESENGISFTEFSYMTLQGYDFLHLCRAHGCFVQAGGSDQWGNITAGIDLIRKVTQQQAYGFTCPLITTSSGEKFGKSAGNAVWLSDERTSPYAFYQYWLNVADADVGRFLKFFSFLENEQIDAIVAEHEADPAKRTGQKALAAEVTRTVHGEKGLQRAETASKALFGGDLTALSEQDLADAFAEAPAADISADQLSVGINIVELAASTGLCKSKGEARRMVEQKAIYINNQRAEGVDQNVDSGSLLPGGVVVLRSGKRNYLLVRAK